MIYRRISNTICLASCAALVITAAGIFAAYYISPTSVFFIFALTLAFFVMSAAAMVVKKSRKSIRSILFVSAFGVVTAVSCVYNFGIQYSKIDTFCRQYDGKTVTVTAVCDEIYYSGDYSFSGAFTVESINGIEYSFGARVEVEGECNISRADRCSFECTMTAITPSGDYFDGKYLLAKGRYALLTAVSTPEFIEKADKNITDYIANFGNWLSERLRISCGEEAGGLASALLTGRRSALDDTLKYRLSRMGLSHIIAISGLHLSILTLGVDFLLKKRFPPQIRMICTVVLSVFAIFITGCSSSVVRCGVMNCVAIFFTLSAMRISPVSSLTLALSMICVVNPNALFDVGLQMSALATLGILLLAPFVHNISVKLFETGIDCGVYSSKSPFAVISSFAVKLSDLLGITIIAQIFTLPVSLYVYGTFPLLSPVYNIIFVPLTQLVIFTAVAVEFAASVPLIAPVFTLALRMACTVFYSLAEAFSPSSVSISVSAEIIETSLLIILSAAITILLTHKIGEYSARGIIIPVAGAIAAIAFILSFSANQAMNCISYANEGLKEAVVVADGVESVIIDISDGSSFTIKCAEDYINESNSSHGITLVLTHLHKRHIRNVKYAINAGIVNKLVIPYPQSESDYSVYNTLSDAAEKANTDIISYDTTQEYEYHTCGGGYITVYPQRYISRSEHPVITFSADNTEQSVIYLSGALNELLDEEEISALTEGYNNIINGLHNPVSKEE